MNEKGRKSHSRSDSILLLIFAGHMLEPFQQPTWARADRRAWSLSLSLLLISGIFAWVARMYGDSWTYRTRPDYVPREISIRAYEMASDLMEFSLGLPNYAFGEYICLEAARPETLLYLPLVLLALAGFSLLAASVSYFGGAWFYGGLAALTAGVISFGAEGLVADGQPGSWTAAAAVLLVALPVYIFQGWLNGWNLARRWWVLMLFYGGMGLLLFPEPWVAGGGARWATALSYPFLLSALLFLVWNACDVFQGMVYLLTKEENNHQSAIHFSVFAVLYLAHFLLIYLKNTGQLVLGIYYPSPFVLQTLTLLAGFWALEKKAPLTGINSPRIPAVHSLYVSLGTLFFGCMALASGLGNDLLTEALEDAICLIHFGMGCSFLLYMFINYFQLMNLGLKIHLVIFKPRYMPLAAIPVFGLAGAMVFVINRDYFPWYQSLAARQVLQADEAGLKGDNHLQESLLLNASGFDHLSKRINMGLAALAYRRGLPGKGQDFAAKAGERSPMAEAHLAIAQHYRDAGLPLYEILALQEGLKNFPEDGRLLNNLGMAFTRTIYTDSAHYYFSRAATSRNGSQAGQTNLGFFYLTSKLEKEGLPRKTPESDSNGDWAELNNNLVFANEAGEKSPLLADIRRKFSEIPGGLQPYLLFHAYLNKAITRDSSDMALLEQLETDSIRMQYREALEMGRALVHYRTGNTRTGLKELFDLQEAAGTNRLDLTLLMGQVYFDQGAYASAAGYFRKAAGMGMKKARYWYALACLDAGRKDDAAAAFSESLPYLSGGDRVRVTVLIDGLRSGRFQNAAHRSDMEKSAYLKTGFSQLSDQQLQDLIYLTSEKEAQRFLWKYAFERAYRENRPERCRKLFQLGHLLFGRQDKGKRLLTSLKPDMLEITAQWKALGELEAAGGLVSFPFARARLAQQRGNTQKARQFFRETLENNPLNNRQAGKALDYLSSDPQEKNFAYEQALALSDLDPFNPEYLKRYGLLAIRNGLTDFGLGVLPRFEVLTSKNEALQLKSTMVAEIAARFPSPVPSSVR